MFGWLNPVGINPNAPAQAKGTIVIFNGDGGVSPGNFGFAASYFNAGYEIVEVAWNDDWEQTYDPFQGSAVGNIQDAACRPATFLNYVYQTLWNSLGNNFAGMCAHGESAGAAQIAYSLAYYGSGSFLDNVELISGPTLSNIQEGCIVPHPQPSQYPVVCGDNNGNQYGCQLGPGGSAWSLNPQYNGGTQTTVSDWTNFSSPSCNNNTTNTSATENTDWLAQSIVDNAAVTGIGAVPTFTYSSTAMSGWLCRTVKLGYGPSNNSSPQAQLFYTNIGSTNSPPNYAVYAVDQCLGAEQVAGGVVPGFYSNDFQMEPTGSTAVAADMVGLTTALGSIPAQCVRRAH